MSLRRYLNLVTENRSQGIYSLCRLNSDSFFYPANEAATMARDLPRLRKEPRDAFSKWMAGKKKKKQAAPLSGQQQQQLESIIRPPRPIFTLRPSTFPVTDDGESNELHSFPLSGTKIFFADRGRRTTLYDTEARCAISTPCLHAPKDWPVALSVPSPAAGSESEGEQEDGNSLYILDTKIDPRNPTPFEALIYRDCATEHYVTTHKTWHLDALPRPPFFDPPPDQCPVVLSYAVVGNVICVSLTDVGTYCFDTASRTWSLAGDWTMPFSGKAEYVPELKLWFGASADHQQLPCAADLSPVLSGHAPKKQQRYVWRDPHLPADWLPEIYDPAAKMVSLGSGRFCIVNYLRDMKDCCICSMGLSESDGDPIVVFSGLEMLAGNGNDTGKGFRMIKHKSRICRDINTCSIEEVF